MWTVIEVGRVATNAAGQKFSPMLTKKFDTKREALLHISKTPFSFIGKVCHTYTIYPRS